MKDSQNLMTDHQFGVEEDSGAVEGVYADAFIVGYDAYRFVVKFGQYQEELAKVKFHTKIIGCPNDIKSFVEILAESLAEYENDHGLIDDK